MAAVHLCTTPAHILKDLLKGRNRLSDQYSCGGCLKTFETICLLHGHCMKHNGGGSYCFDHVTGTAYPKYDSYCSYTQVSEGNFKDPGGREIVTRPRDISKAVTISEDKMAMLEPEVTEQENDNVPSDDWRRVEKLASALDKHEANEKEIEKHNFEMLEVQSDRTKLSADIQNYTSDNANKVSGIKEESAEALVCESVIVSVKNIVKSVDGSITFEMNETDTHLFDATASAIMDRINTVGDNWINNGMEFQLQVQHRSMPHTGVKETQPIKTEMESQNKHLMTADDTKHVIENNPAVCTKQAINKKPAVDTKQAVNTMQTIGTKHSVGTKLSVETQREVDIIQIADSIQAVEGTLKPDDRENASKVLDTSVPEKLVNSKFRLDKTIKPDKDSTVKAEVIDINDSSNARNHKSSKCTKVNRRTDFKDSQQQTVADSLQCSRRSKRQRKPNSRLLDSEWAIDMKKPTQEQSSKNNVMPLSNVKHPDKDTAEGDKRPESSDHVQVSASEILLSLGETDTDGTQVVAGPSSVRLKKRKKDIEGKRSADGQARVKRHHAAHGVCDADVMESEAERKDMNNICNVPENADETTEGSNAYLNQEEVHKEQVKGSDDKDKKDTSAGEEELNSDEPKVVSEDESTIQNVRFSKHKTRRKCKVGVSESKRKDHMCVVCGKMGTRAMVAYHKQIHSSEIPYTCEVCGKGFKTRPCFKAHMRQHGEKQFRCDLCPAAFYRNQYLVSHMRSHTGETPFVCDICGSCFKEYYILQRHIKNVHQQERKFTCDICGLKFFRLDTRDKHRQRHFPPTLKCMFCSKMFKGELDKRKHELTHTGEKQVYCPHCHQGFAQLWPYYRHMWKKHNIQKDEAKEIRIKNPDLVFMRNKNFVYGSEDTSDSTARGIDQKHEDLVATTLEMPTGSIAASSRYNVQAQTAAPRIDEHGYVSEESEIEEFQIGVSEGADATVEQFIGQVEAGSNLGPVGDRGDTELEARGVVVVQDETGGTIVVDMEGIQGLVGAQGEKAVTLNEQKIFVAERL